MLIRIGRLLPAVALLSLGVAPANAQVDCNCSPQPVEFSSSHGGSFGSAGGSFGSAGGSFGSAGGEFLPTGSSFGSSGGSFGGEGGCFGSAGGSFGSAGGSFGSAGGSYGSAGGFPLSQGMLRPLDDQHARIILNVPDEAVVVYLGKKKMTTEGLTRSYLIPVPKPDKTYKYVVKIVVAGDADVLSKESEQTLKAGETVELNVSVGDEITIDKAAPAADDGAATNDADADKGADGGGDDGGES
ncbi:MAG: hypothetical protein R3C19_19790 [Planctomycetaceae bacterium]